MDQISLRLVHTFKKSATAHTASAFASFMKSYPMWRGSQQGGEGLPKAKIPPTLRFMICAHAWCRGASAKQSLDRVLACSQRSGSSKCVLYLFPCLALFSETKRSKCSVGCRSAFMSEEGRQDPAGPIHASICISLWQVPSGGGTVRGRCI